MEELEERKDSGKIIEEMVKYADTVEDKLTVSKISNPFREILGTEGWVKTPNHTQPLPLGEEPGAVRFIYQKCGSVDGGIFHL